MATTARSWSETNGLGINGDFVPQCDYMNPLANGERGPWLLGHVRQRQRDDPCEP